MSKGPASRVGQNKVEDDRVPRRVRGVLLRSDLMDDGDLIDPVELEPVRLVQEQPLPTKRCRGRSMEPKVSKNLYLLNLLDHWSVASSTVMLPFPRLSKIFTGSTVQDPLQYVKVCKALNGGNISGHTIKSCSSASDWSGCIECGLDLET